MSNRFVILEHDHPELHWDFMLEVDDVLKTWRLPAIPTTGEMVVQSLPDHRLAYIEHEGPISRDRGSVKRWDRGIFEWIVATDEEKSVRLDGDKVHGTVTLARGVGDSWRATWNLDS